MGMERIAAINRALFEAAQNASQYARAQQYATWSANEWSLTTTRLNRILAELAPAWEIISGLFARIINSLLLIPDLFQQAMTVLQRSLYAGASSIVEPLRDFLRSIGLWGMPQWATEIITYLKEVLYKLNILARPTATTSVNDWFRADVLTITGRVY
jgi:hypothetical protein